MSGHSQSTTYHYVIVRRDLPPGLLAAQIVHAAGETSPGNLQSGTHAVVLEVADEASLKEVSAQLRAAGVPHKPIIEPDIGNTWTAIGVAPLPKARVYPHLKHLGLYGDRPKDRQKEAA